MRKINILDLLCDDYIKQNELEQSYLSSCINIESLDKDIKLYVIPYLENIYKLFDLDFDFNINSNDEIEKYKSLLLLLSISKGTIDLISSNPNLFNTYKDKYDIKTAYEEITLRVLIGNILDLKKSLNKIDIFKMINLLFKNKNLDILFSSLEELISSKTERNLPNINILFNKLKKYKIELINNQIVGINDLENLCQTSPDIISKTNKDGVTIYRIKGQDFKVIVDYAHTPNGYLNLFELTKTLNAKRTIIVAGSAGERDKTKRPLMGSILVNNADLVVFTYEDPRSEDPNDIIDDLTSEVLDKKDKFIRIVDREEAINYAINEAKTGDMVLILGKGNETYEALKDGKIYFNDVECTKKALEKRIKSRV